MATQKATPPVVTERALVEDMAESVALHGFKVVKHQVSFDHEREETRLNVSFVKANPNQTVLKLAKDPDGERDGDGD